MIQIVGHRVLIKPFAVEEIDEKFKAAKNAGIIIPDSDSEALRKTAVDRGIVVGIGNTAFIDFGGTPWCSIGDEVFFSRYAGKHITDPYTEDKFVALNDEDIIAVVQKENK